MKAKVVKAFCCRIDGARYLPGSEYEAGEARIAELAAQGYVEAAKAAPKRAARKKAAEPKE